MATAQALWSRTGQDVFLRRRPGGAGYSEEDSNLRCARSMKHSEPYSKVCSSTMPTEMPSRLSWARIGVLSL